MILNKSIKSSGKCNPKTKIIFLWLSISGNIKKERDTFNKYEYKYKICQPHMASVNR